MLDYKLLRKNGDLYDNDSAMGLCQPTRIIVIYKVAHLPRLNHMVNSNTLL